MKYLLRIALVTQFCLVFGSIVDPNSGWSYVQSTGQTFYMLVESDQMEISDGMGNQIEVNGRITIIPIQYIIHINILKSIL